MEDNLMIDKDIARVLDILEQIKGLNKMIAMHRDESGDEFMASQYVDLKNRFLNELKELLDEFEIEVIIKDKDQAA